MIILAIDTACDETSVAVTQDTTVLSNIVWSQASQHAQWGGIYPSLAQRLHRERIDWTIEKALKNARVKIQNLDAIAVTVGPGLAIALEVGISKAKELSIKYNKPLIAVNHIEAHLLSPLALPKTNNKKNIDISLPALGLVISGGHTDLILVEKIGKYKILAQTQDDALGEALDKAARMLGLGYPGGAILEKLARVGSPNCYSLPLPMTGREKEGRFSYSGLKTAMYRLTEKEKPLTKEKIQNLAACFQDRAFEHLVRVIASIVRCSSFDIYYLLVGGGVSNNIEVRKRLRKLCRPLKIKVLLPYTKKLCGDNAAMIGTAAYFKFQKGEFERDVKKIDRIPRFNIDRPFVV